MIFKKVYCKIIPLINWIGVGLLLIDVYKVQALLDWVKVKILLDIKAESAKERIVKRGQVYKCNLGIGVGSEMQKERPCVILQNAIGNLKSGNTIVAPITHNKSNLSCLVSIKTIFDGEGNIHLDGQVNVSNIVCVSKARLGNFISNLDNEDMRKIDFALARNLGLMSQYNELKLKLDDKIKYIESLKKERNDAQDFVKRLKECMNVDSDSELEETIKKMVDKIIVKE